MPAMIDIVEYRAAWIDEFQQIAETLLHLLRDSALRIDHLGSTTVPLLCAKDIIDVQVTVAALEPEIAAKLLAAGYTTHPDVRQDHVPPGYEGSAADWAKFFFMQPKGQRRINIHVRRAGRQQRYALLFRDFLRANRRTAMAYGELKRRLASSLSNAKAYPEVKDPAVDLIYFAAEQWAVQTGWHLPPVPPGGQSSNWT
jgi:GrpB-like predicted nucleotidyltransferase (UPF0157 family)